MANAAKSYELTKHENYFVCSFHAMASPCEFLIDTLDEKLAHQLSAMGVAQVKRIEQKFSRYVRDNVCFAINNAEGERVSIDEEYFRLLNYADTCYQLSDGLFDVTSGVLRAVWRFDGSDRLPTQDQIETVLPLVGWQRVNFDECSLQMPAQMELDFGGIGKEYAVSTVADLCRQHAPGVSVLVNLGGDIQISRPRENGTPWLVGIENDTRLIALVSGALATSGDAKRYLQKDGVRYSHILNPRTGWPVTNAPASVTVAAPLCIQAGSLATLALLQGENAEDFMKEQNVEYWCRR